MAQKSAFDQCSPENFIILPIILPNEIHKNRRRDLRSYEKACAQKSGAKYYQGSVPFGFTLSNGQLIDNETEQKTIGLLSRLKSAGHSLREIAAELKAQNIPTKNNGIWQANTVRKILLKNAPTVFCAEGRLTDAGAVRDASSARRIGWKMVQCRAWPADGIKHFAAAGAPATGKPD